MQERESFKRPPVENSKSSSALSVFLALMVAAFVIGMLVFLTMGMFGAVLLVAGGLVIFAALQYLIWGWWIERYLRDHVEKDEADNS